MLKILTLIALCGATVMSSGCVSTDQKRLSAAAETKGKSQAAVILPEYPDECRANMPRAYPSLNEKPRNTQLRWEFIADVEDRKNDRCAGFYDDVRGRLGSTASRQATR